MANNLQLWVSADTGKLIASPTSSVTANRQTFYAGDSVELEVHLIQGVGVARVPYEVPFPAGSTVKVSIGTVATAPTGGNWRLSVSSTETSDLAYNATPATIQTALNAIGAVAAAGGVTVTALGGGYSITWNTVGTKPTILPGTDTLIPSSYESIYILQSGSASVQEIVFVELRQSPLALADTFSPIGNPVATATTVSAWNGTNKIVRVAISPTPRSGTYTITVDGDSAAIPYFANSSQVYSLLSSAGVTAINGVNQIDTLSFDIILSQDLTVTVDGSGLIASSAIVGTLDLATSEMIAYLGSEATAEAVIEVSVTAAGQTRTMAQVPCTVANAVLSPGAVSPIGVGTLLTESVANARYIRRDAAQSPSSADLDIIWPNLGVTVDGSDLAAALSAANAPASGNAIATMADIPAPPDLTPYLLSATAASTYQTIAGMSSYLTTASASSTYQTISGMSSYLTTASAASTYLTISSAASTYALLSSFDQGVKTTDTPSFVGINLINPTAGSTIISNEGRIELVDDGAGVDGGVFVTGTNVAFSAFDGVASTTILTPLGITFPDLTTQETRVVQDTQANGGGFSTGGFDTVHYPYEVKVIDNTGTAYWVPARLA